MEISADVLRAAATDPAAPAWKIIWALNHQGTFDPAPAELLPWLATTIRAFADDSEITPGLSSGRAERLHAEALRAGRDTVAAGLTRLFGRLGCPGCGTHFNVADNLAGIEQPPLGPA